MHGLHTWAATGLGAAPSLGLSHSQAHTWPSATLCQPMGEGRGVRDREWVRQREIAPCCFGLRTVPVRSASPGRGGLDIPGVFGTATCCEPGRFAVRLRTDRGRSPVRSASHCRGGLDIPGVLGLATCCEPGRFAVLRFLADVDDCGLSLHRHLTSPPVYLPRLPCEVGEPISFNKLYSGRFDGLEPVGKPW